MGIVDNFKDIFKVAEALNNHELYKKLTELQTRAMVLEEENRGLKEELNRLNERLVVKETLTYDGERYWMDKDAKKEGPYCSVCWDVDSKLVRLRKYQITSGGIRYTCDYCSHHRTR